MVTMADTAEFTIESHEAIQNCMNGNNLAADKKYFSSEFV